MTDKLTPMACVTCGRDVRPAKTDKADYPYGTVIAVAKGQCATCYKKGELIVELEEDVALPWAESPSVLIRADITPNAYKVLSRLGVDIGQEFATYASRRANELAAQHLAEAQDRDAA
jgi:hypothetical protein